MIHSAISWKGEFPKTGYGSWKQYLERGNKSGELSLCCTESWQEEDRWIETHHKVLNLKNKTVTIKPLLYMTQLEAARKAG